MPKVRQFTRGEVSADDFFPDLEDTFFGLLREQP